VEEEREEKKKKKKKRSTVPLSKDNFNLQLNIPSPNNRMIAGWRRAGRNWAFSNMPSSAS